MGEAVQKLIAQRWPVATSVLATVCAALILYIVTLTGQRYDLTADQLRDHQLTLRASILELTTALQDFRVTVEALSGRVNANTTTLQRMLTSIQALTETQGRIVERLVYLEARQSSQRPSGSPPRLDGP